MRVSGWKGLLLAAAGFATVVLPGCAGREFAPKQGVMYYHRELPAADRAIEAAKAAGKNYECPKAFKAAEDTRKDAYDIYLSCRTREGIAKANEATAMAKALCPPAAAYPDVKLAADPPAVFEGQCSKLTWSTANVAKAAVKPGIGDVAPNGSKEVCPPSTTQYELAASGPGGTLYEYTTVTVNPKPAPPPPPPMKAVAPPPPPMPAPVAPKAPERLTLHINFDTNKADIRKTDVPELQKAIAFVRSNPGRKFAVVGYTDDRGSEKYNQKLSERRAQAVKKYLVDKGGVPAGEISASGKGEADPVGDNKTEKGRFENRRVEIATVTP
jgi:OmpA-OmpF porin, OOP family